MAGIYLRDKNINKDGTGAKRSPADFRTDFKEIFPNNPQIQKETSTELGSIIIFVHDNDANLIFNQQVKAKLSAKNMSANLSSPTRLDREIYLINVPIDIYQKDIQEIKTEIVKITGYRTLEVIKFNGNNSGKKYIVLTVDSKDARDNILNLGPMPLFGATISAKKPIRKANAGNSITQQQQDFNLRRPPAFLPQPPPGIPTPAAWQCPPPPMNSYVNHLTDSNIWPVLPQGTPYSWQTAANPSSQLSAHQPFQPAAPSPPPRRTGSHMNGHQPSFSAPPPLSPPSTGESHFRPPILNNEIELKFFVCASAHICKIIHEGLEDPSEYLYKINEVFSMQGLPSIVIPNNQLLNSRIKYFRKSSNSSASNITSPTSHSHSSSPPLTATSPPMSNQGSLSNQSPTPPPSPVSNSPSTNSPPLIQFSPAHVIHTSTSATNSPSPTEDSTTPLIQTPSSASAFHLAQSLSNYHQPSLPSTLSTPYINPSSDITFTPSRSFVSLPINSSRHLNPNPVNLFHPCNSSGAPIYPNYTVSKETDDATIMTFSRVPETNPSTTTNSLEID